MVPGAERVRGGVAFGLGVLLLVGTLSAGGFHLDDDVYRYDAARVRVPPGGPLVVTDVTSGTRVHLRDVDDDVVCETGFETRTCAFERFLHGSNATLRGHPALASEHEFAYLDGRFYRVGSERVNGSYRMTLTPSPRDPALRAISWPTRSLSGPAMEAVRTGDVVTYRPLAPDERFVRANGTYYALYRSGFRDFGPDDRTAGASCSHRRGDGFCFWAGVRRVGTTGASLGGFLVGAALVAVGLRGPVRRAVWFVRLL